MISYTFVRYPPLHLVVSSVVGGDEKHATGIWTDRTAGLLFRALTASSDSGSSTNEHVMTMMLLLQPERRGTAEKSSRPALLFSSAAILVCPTPQL